MIEQRPVTYHNNKAPKQNIEYKKLWEVALWGFGTQIGPITNDSTTGYEIQSQFSPKDKEYIEWDKRLKLFRYFQGNEIDRAKNGSKVKKIPKEWSNFQTILETDTEEEIARKKFENKLIIDKRPEFMKFLYPKYMKEYKAFVEDFDTYCCSVFGKKYKELTEKDKNSELGKQVIEYYDKKNPLLETDGVMNRLCRHMQSELKDVKKKNPKCDNTKIFESLYNPLIELDNAKLELLLAKKKEYDDFKQSKQLKTSEFSTYEQYYKYLRNDCLEKISSNIQELANLAVYICYNLNPNKPKDFCWDIFGGGIVENLQEKHTTIKVPHMCETGDIEYLGEKYEMVEIDLVKQSEIDNFEFDEHIFDDLDDMFGDLESLEE